MIYFVWKRWKKLINQIRWAKSNIICIKNPPSHWHDCIDFIFNFTSNVIFTVFVFVAFYSFNVLPYLYYLLIKTRHPLIQHNRYNVARLPVIFLSFLFRLPGVLLKSVGNLLPTASLLAKEWRWWESNPRLNSFKIVSTNDSSNVVHYF